MKNKSFCHIRALFSWNISCFRSHPNHTTLCFSYVQCIQVHRHRWVWAYFNTIYIIRTGSFCLCLCRCRCRVVYYLCVVTIKQLVCQLPIVSEPISNQSVLVPPMYSHYTTHTYSDSHIHMHADTGGGVGGGGGGVCFGLFSNTHYMVVFIPWLPHETVQWLLPRFVCRHHRHSYRHYCHFGYWLCCC